MIQILHNFNDPTVLFRQVFYFFFDSIDEKTGTAKVPAIRIPTHALVLVISDIVNLPGFETTNFSVGTVTSGPTGSSTV